MLIFFKIKHNNNGDTMKIRLGYVGLSKTIDITSSKTITYTNYLKSKDFNKINELIITNLNNLKEILIYNIKNNIHFFRITSKLIPLATISDFSFDYIKPYQKYYNEIAQIIKENNLRIDVHPDQYAVLNSTKKEVVENTFKILEYNYNILNALKIKDKVIILHIGSNVLGKENSIKRFINNFNKLPDHIKKCIVLENDDKIYNAFDTLNLCNKLKIPMVLDVHHHICNYTENINYEEIFKTWKITPKIHFSSPKNKTKKDFRSHNDYIDSNSFIEFINQIKHLNFDIDIMLEAKCKDDALFKLVRELKYKTNYKFIDETSFFV